MAYERKMKNAHRISCERSLRFLRLNVTTMPVYADRSHRFDTATSLPKVVHITVVYRADGTRAQMYPQVFRDYEELEAAVNAALSGQN